MMVAGGPAITQASRRIGCHHSRKFLLNHARQHPKRITHSSCRPQLQKATIGALMASAAAPNPNQAHYAAGDQLVTEIYVAQMQSAMDFFTSFGFKVERSEHGFAVLRWGPSVLYLEEVPEYVPMAAGAMYHGQAANIRVLVPDVDAYHAKAMELGYSIVRGIKDQYYGLRDFTVAGPDGVALRFATPTQDNFH